MFITCKQYGHVVDTYIPLKRSKAGKRFGFVRFINVFSVERLVNNLCTIWIDKYKLQANTTRFQRPSLNSKASVPTSVGGGKSNLNNVKVNSNLPKNQNPKVNGTSFVNVVKGHNDKDSPALVLEDDCVMSKDLSNCLLGRVKEFASLANIKTILNNEGFMNIKIKYVGEKWIMLEFDDTKAMNLFRNNVSVASWFSQFIQASTDFVLESRIAWVEIEGIPLKLWSDNTFKRIAAKWGVMLDIDDQDDDCFHSKRICVQTNCHHWISDVFKIIFRGKVFWIRAKETPGWVPDFANEEDDEDISDVDSKDGAVKVDENETDGFSDVEGVPETVLEDDESTKKHSVADNIGNQEYISEDPFNLYPLLKKKATDTHYHEHESSLKYPPGFTPKEGEEGVSMNVKADKDATSASGNVFNVSGDDKGFCNNHPDSKLKEGGSESVCSGHFKKSKGPRTGGSILNLLDDVVKVGQVMGYNMDGCMTNMAEIIKSQGVEEVF
ncbi:nucleotide-binding alpha-beta plait domain-containing protein [Tanacetum coccineum]|uniref:Nucleotide-binding alpha-beta plait domain-containing protein n=1 Tax=Tanacetum coccineum TaxID=301880 RepID=A0ABQ5HWV7_9ASTR